MRDLIIALPLPAITVILFVFFAAVSLGARWYVRSRRDDEGREAASEQAKSLLTGVAATFAFFVGFAINVTWGAVTAGQLAVEQQAAALQSMAWEIDHIPDRQAATVLMDKLRLYATAAAEQDSPFLARGDAAKLPSTAPLNDFENALHALVSGAAGGPAVPSWQVSPLTSAASSLRSASASVAAVANRAVPVPLAVLVIVVGVIASIVMGVTTVVYERATLVYVWCLIPALSITVVFALAYPFAIRSEANLTPLRVIAAQLQSP